MATHTRVFDPSDFLPAPYAPDKRYIKEIIRYCAVRFRAAVEEILKSGEEAFAPGAHVFRKEMASLPAPSTCMSYIGLGAILGFAVDTPPIIRFLSTVNIFSDTMRQVIEAGPEVMDADAAVTDFLFPWWLPGPIADYTEERSFGVHSAKECLNFHRNKIRELPAEERLDDSSGLKTLFKQNYMFPLSAFGDVPVPPGKEACTRCRLYRAVALGSQNQLRDLRNVLQGGKGIYRTATQLSIRRASNFNQLYEAAVNKEAATSSANTLPPNVAAAASQGAGSGPGTSKGKGKGKKKAEAGKAVEDWRALSQERLAESQQAQSLPGAKWVYGPDLTDKDLLALVRGADRDFVLPHTGYDESLDERSIGYPSPPGSLAGDPPFFELSADIWDVPNLEPDDYPRFQIILPDLNPDPVREGAGAGAGLSLNQPPIPASLLPMPPKGYVKLPVPVAFTLPPAAINSAGTRPQVIDLTAVSDNEVGPDAAAALMSRVMEDSDIEIGPGVAAAAFHVHSAGTGNVSDTGSEVGPGYAALAFRQEISSGSDNEVGPGEAAMAVMRMNESDDEVGPDQAAAAFTNTQSVSGEDEDDSEEDSSEDEEEIGPDAAAAALRVPVPGPYTASSFSRFDSTWLGQ